MKKITSTLLAASLLAPMALVATPNSAFANGDPGPQGNGGAVGNPDNGNNGNDNGRGNAGGNNGGGKDRKSTRLNSSHSQQSRMPSSA